MPLLSIVILDSLCKTRLLWGGYVYDNVSACLASYRLVNIYMTQYLLCERVFVCMASRPFDCEITLKTSNHMFLFFLDSSFFWWGRKQSKQIIEKRFMSLFILYTS